MSDYYKIERVQEILDEANSKVKPLELKIPFKKVKKFCEIVEETNPIYLDLEQAKKNGHERIPIPESYLLSLVSPITHNFFTGIGKYMGSVFKGVIHSSSKIEHLIPLYCDLPYLMEMELRNLSYKTGKLGKYYVAEYFISIKNEKKEFCYTDIHYFFIKVGNGGFDNGKRN